jgi:hypothetical protein
MKLLRLQIIVFLSVSILLGSFSYVAWATIQLSLDSGTDIEAGQNEQSIVAYTDIQQPRMNFLVRTQRAGHIRLLVYNQTGRLVARINSKEFLKKTHQISWKYAHLEKGIYYVSVRQGWNTSQNLKIALDQ